MRIWEISSGRALHILQGHTSWIESVAFSQRAATLERIADPDGLAGPGEPTEVLAKDRGVAEVRDLPCPGMGRGASDRDEVTDHSAGR